MDFEDLRRKRRRIFEPSSKDELEKSQMPAALDGVENDHIMIGGTKATDNDARLAGEPTEPIDQEERCGTRPGLVFPLNGNAAMSEDSLTPSQRQAWLDEKLIKEFAKTISHLTCSQCQAPLPGIQKAAQEVQTHILDGSESFTVICHGCEKQVCPGCGEETTEATNTMQGEGLKLRYHCSASQTVAIWALLCKFDETSVFNRPATSRPNTSLEPRAALKKQGKGVGYADDTDIDEYHEYDLIAGLSTAFTGTGHTLGSAEDSIDANATIPGLSLQISSTAIGQDILQNQLSLQDSKAITNKIFLAIVDLVPNIEGSHNFDEKFYESLRTFFRSSTMLEAVATLFRNGDLEEVIRQKESYHGILSLVKTLGNHQPTRSLIFGERRAYPLGHSLLRISMGEYSTVLSDCLGQPLHQSIKDLGAQCDLLLSRNADSPEQIALYTAIHDTSKWLADAAHSNALPATNDVPQDKNAWQKDIRVCSAPDLDIMNNHCMSEDFQIDNVPKRMARIVREISILQTSLPDGIFVRYAESRPDIMKVLIIGPKDTPYENGLFEFDLFCNGDFPEYPPEMKLRTTGGGQVVFNPNLYADGMVCLSLLGTFSGPTWKIDQSTLLQVLVSIQAMIFVAEPIGNEPGWEMFLGTEKSDEYNAAILPNTMRYALLEWLEEKGRREGIWAEVVTHHFATSEEEIRRCVDAWAERGKGKWKGVTGTGWAGKRLGEADEVEEAREVVQDEMVGGGLVAHLKGALNALG